MRLLSSLMVVAVAFHGVALHLCPCFVRGRQQGCGARPPAPEQRACCAKKESPGPRLQSAGCCCETREVRSVVSAAPAPPGSVTGVSAAAPAAALAPPPALVAARAISLPDCRGPAPPPPPDPQAVLRIYRI